MSINQALLGEMRHEAQSTRKLLAVVPEGKSDWKPHDKSMPLGNLAGHLARLPGWAELTLAGDGLDLEQPFPPEPVPETREQLLKLFDDAMATYERIVGDASDEQLMSTWTLRKGDQVILEMPKAAVMRSWVHNHLYHHRGQLTVYLRLLGQPLPQVYGPTADEPDF